MESCLRVESCLEVVVAGDSRGPFLEGVLRPSRGVQGGVSVGQVGDSVGPTSPDTVHGWQSTLDGGTVFHLLAFELLLQLDHQGKDVGVRRYLGRQ